MGTERIPYLLGHAEIARLFDVAPDTPQLWRKRAILGEPDLVISGKPYWLLPTVLALAKTRYRQVTPERLAEYKASIPNGHFSHISDNLTPLVGIKEVASIFGKKPADIGQWRNRGTLATPDVILSGSPLWRLTEILADAEHRGRTVSIEAVERIRAGIREPVRPRGRRGALPAARIFTGEESVAAVNFVRRILSSGHAVEVRPRSVDEIPPKFD